MSQIVQGPASKAKRVYSMLRLETWEQAYVFINMSWYLGNDEKLCRQKLRRWKGTVSQTLKNSFHDNISSKELW